MRKFFIIIILLGVSVINFAQVTESQAIENPLDCAFYLQLKEKPDDRIWSDIQSLAYFYFQVGKFGKVIQTIQLLEDKGLIVDEFVRYSNELIEQKNFAVANRFLDKSFRNLDRKNYPRESTLAQLAKNLVTLNREKEAFDIANKFADKEEVVSISLSIAKSFLKANKFKALNEFIKQDSFPKHSSDYDIQAEIALIYAKVNQAEKAKKVIKYLQKNAFDGLVEVKLDNAQRRILPLLWKVNLELNEVDKAFEIFNQYDNNENYFVTFQFISDLISFQHYPQAIKLLHQLENNKQKFDNFGSRIVEAYLKLGNIDYAVSIAKSISDQEDNYGQQAAFIHLANSFINAGEIKKADEILDFAFQRARKIVYRHETMESVGSSSGSRKQIYLRQIADKYIFLKEYQKAYLVIKSINSDHHFAKEFVAENLIKLAKIQVKTLPKKEIENLLTEANSVFSADEEDYSSNLIKALSAEVYARLGAKTKATDMLAEVLKFGRESCCYENNLLLTVGKIFEQNELQPTLNLKKVLKTIIEDN